MVIPKGTSLGGFLIKRYFEEGKIPVDFTLGYRYAQTVPTMLTRVNAIPDQITSDLTVYPITIPGKPSPVPRPRYCINCVRVKRRKNTDKLITAIKDLEVKEATADTLEGKALWFRGLSHTVLMLTLSFFYPSDQWKFLRQ